MNFEAASAAEHLSGACRTAGAVASFQGLKKTQNKTKQSTKNKTKNKTVHKNTKHNKTKQSISVALVAQLVP